MVFVLFIYAIDMYHYIMKLWDAIKQMRVITANDGCFSMSFMSYNSTTNTSEGVVDVVRAKLRKKADSKSYRNADVLMPYHDYTNNEPRQFYLPCLMSFNGQQITYR